ncbi:hypothetical protein TCON_2092 [Astathelohania contejeani]|uniref:Uncharacterized protein n=1 Tax=Astathelohania contejeani TaxID=164912 RepID=A0ABQ7HX25_9MICR|nr:hypothetical protein TCON_2092 [Thelohania contejeani]
MKIDHIGVIFFSSAFLTIIILPLCTKICMDFTKDKELCKNFDLLISKCREHFDEFDSVRKTVIENESILSDISNEVIKLAIDKKDVLEYLVETINKENRHSALIKEPTTPNNIDTTYLTKLLTLQKQIIGCKGNFKYNEIKISEIESGNNIKITEQTMFIFYYDNKGDELIIKCHQVLASKFQNGKIDISNEINQIFSSNESKLTKLNIKTIDTIKSYISNHYYCGKKLMINQLYYLIDYLSEQNFIKEKNVYAISLRFKVEYDDSDNTENKLKVYISAQKHKQDSNKKFIATTSISALEHFDTAYINHDDCQFILPLFIDLLNFCSDQSQ